MQRNLVKFFVFGAVAETYFFRWARAYTCVYTKYIYRLGFWLRTPHLDDIDAKREKPAISQVLADARC